MSSMPARAVPQKKGNQNIRGGRCDMWLEKWRLACVRIIFVYGEERGDIQILSWTKAEVKRKALE